MNGKNDACSTFKEFIEEGGPTILFAGAGVSAQAGLPVWTSYLEQLAEFARIHDPLVRHIMHERINEGELLNAAEHYFLCHKIPQAEKFQNLVLPLEKYDQNLLAPLVNIPFSSIVTTNFDRCLIDAYAQVYNCAAEEVNYGDPTLAAAPFNNRFYIARINGRVEVPESMQLSERHFEGLSCNTQYIDFLSHLFTRYRLLFVGFSFLDPAIRQVFDLVNSKVGKYHEGRHLALLPDDADDEFIKKLEQFSISKVFYNSENNHHELWECFSQFNSEGVTEIVEKSIASTGDPFSLTKKYLCACYARASLGSKVYPLRKAVVEGIVASLIDDAGEEGISESVLYGVIAEELAVPEVDVIPLVDSAFKELADNQLITSTKLETGKIFFNSDQDSAVTYERDLKLLENGVLDRYVVRSSGEDNKEVRRCVRLLFDYLISSRGWDLGAAFAGGNVPDQIDIPLIIQSNEEIRVSLGESEVISLSRSIDDLIGHPNKKEAEVLSELGRTSFALELITHTAHDTLFHALTLPSKIYLDANVLMPAFTPGHPYQEVYQAAISNLVAAATSVLSSVEIVAYKGFLNEIVSHRRLAIDEMRFLDKDSKSSLRKEALLYGTINMNVYIGGYANILASGKDLNFSEYLGHYAPYTTENELAKWLEEKGISIKGDSELKAGSNELPDILHYLEKANADGKWHKKEGTLIMHDAVQLAALSRDLREGIRVVFVSADRRLRENICKSKFSSIANSMISHVGLAQLVDLLVGNPSHGKGLARMLWGGKTTSGTEQIRNYLVDLALDDYNEGYAMEMNNIVDNISEDVLLELNRQELKLDSNKANERAAVMNLLEGFEDVYFQKMREVIEEKQGKNN